MAIGHHAADNPRNGSRAFAISVRASTGSIDRTVDSLSIDLDVIDCTRL
ncbi:unnamed protein product [Haemonchus placei]|uniref:DUF501 domain-containing protein n=1 Tax=Haemonchus placei TaxID=6290 RepID=A0A0N4VXI9_HAEPC|nr:unnamed protein product [Haemonchus placei]